MSDRIAGAFNRSEATGSVALDIHKAFDWVSHAGFFTNLSQNFRSDIWPHFFFSQ